MSTSRLMKSFVRKFSTLHPSAPCIAHTMNKMHKRHFMDDIYAKGTFNTFSHKDLQFKLYEAIIKNDPSVVAFILEMGVDVNAFRYFGDSFLHRAVEANDNSDILKLLLPRIADPNIKNAYGETPLHFVPNKFELAKLLLQKNADPNVPDNEGRTPLYNCCNQYALDNQHATENEKIIRLFLEKGANPYLENCDGVTSLALIKTNLNLLQNLLESGVDFQNHNRPQNRRM